MENSDLSAAISALLTAAVAAIIRYFEKKSIERKRDDDSTQHLRK